VLRAHVCLPRETGVQLSPVTAASNLTDHCTGENPPEVVGVLGSHLCPRDHIVAIQQTRTA
jgi:hypothetical protein